jgi:YD repeat-containing protein
VRFSSHLADGRLEFGIVPETGAAAMPTARTFDLKVHNVGGRPRAVQAGGKAVAWRWDANRRLLEVTLPAVRSAPLQVVVML